MTWDSSPSVSELKKTIYTNGFLTLFHLPSTQYTELQTDDFTFWCKQSDTSTDGDEVDMEVKMLVCPSVLGIALGLIKNPIL
jgi:hypothetical protein